MASSSSDKSVPSPVQAGSATYEIDNTSGARWRWKELRDLAALTDLEDGNLRSAWVSLTSTSWPIGFAIDSPGQYEEVDGVSAWSIIADAYYGVNVNRVAADDVAIAQRAIMGQTTTGAGNRIRVKYTKQGAPLDKQVPSLYFDFTLFLDSLALDYLRKRSRFVNQMLGVSLEQDLSIMRSYVAPNERSSCMVTFYTRCWLRVFNLVWAEAHGIPLAWGEGGQGSVNVNVFSNNATWATHSRPALNRCQAGLAISLIAESMAEEEVNALFVFAAEHGVVCTLESEARTFRPYSDRYAMGPLAFELWSHEAYIRHANTHATNANAPVPGVRFAAPSSALEARNTLYRICLVRHEQKQFASAFGVAAGLFVGRPFLMQGVAIRNGGAASDFLPARPVYSCLNMRQSIDSSPLFPIFAQDSFVDSNSFDDATFLSTITPAELYSLAAHMGMCTGFSYSTAFAIGNMCGAAFVPRSPRSGSIRADIGLNATTTLQISEIDRLARSVYLRTFYMSPMPFQFGGISSGFDHDLTTIRNNPRSLDKFIRGRELPVTVYGAEVLQSAVALPYTCQLPLAGDRAIALALITPMGNSFRIGFPGNEVLMPGSQETFEPELLLRSFVASELASAARPVTMVEKAANTRPNVIDWVAAETLEVEPGYGGTGLIANDKYAVTRLGDGQWRRVRFDITVAQAGRYVYSMQGEGTRNKLALVWPTAGVVDEYVNGPVIYSSLMVLNEPGPIAQDSVTQLSAAQMVRETIDRERTLAQLIASIEKIRVDLLERHKRAKAYLDARVAELRLDRPIIPAKRTFTQVSGQVLPDALPPPPLSSTNSDVGSNT